MPILYLDLKDARFNKFEGKKCDIYGSTGRFCLVSKTLGR